MGVIAQHPAALDRRGQVFDPPFFQRFQVMLADMGIAFDFGDG